VRKPSLSSGELALLLGSSSDRIKSQSGRTSSRFSRGSANR